MHSDKTKYKTQHNSKINPRYGSKQEKLVIFQFFIPKSFDNEDFGIQSFSSCFNLYPRFQGVNFRMCFASKITG
jgi:hypothetical protein